MIRRIDDLGRVVIPKELRNLLNIKEGDELDVTVEGNIVFLRKHVDHCVYCASPVEIKYDDRLLCRACLDKLGG